MVHETASNNVTAMESMHWSDAIYEVQNACIHDWTVAGGSDFGQFGYFLDSGDVILELDGVKVAGVTRADLLNLISAKETHHLKAVSSSTAHDLPVDLREYLSRRFARGSIDHELQTTIRENVYLRTVPCTTRPPKPNERDGVDYKFLTKEEFLELERSGVLLESGTYDGHFYGTLMPLSSATNPIAAGFDLTQVEDHQETLDMDAQNSQKSETLTQDDNMQASGRDVPPPNTPSAASNSNQGESISSYHRDMAAKRRRNRSCVEAIECITLPQGWERIHHPDYGVYYVDHVNKRTQYERPYEIELVKGPQGFGFTLIEVMGGHIMVKNVLPGGPAFSTGVIQPGDILVSVSGVSVSGLQHSDIARLFATFAAGDRVTLTFARSHYPVMAPTYKAPMLKENPQQLEEMMPQPSAEELEEQDTELLKITIEKGANGFGFTICDTSKGQRVKKVLDADRCGALQQGDILVMFNTLDVRQMTHEEVVNELKSFTAGESVRFTIRRKKRFRSKTPLTLPTSSSSLPYSTATSRNCKTPSFELLQSENNTMRQPSNGIMTDGMGDPRPLVNGDHQANGMPNNYTPADPLAFDDGTYLTPILLNQHSANSLSQPSDQRVPQTNEDVPHEAQNGHATALGPSHQPNSPLAQEPMSFQSSQPPSLNHVPGAEANGGALPEDDEYEYHRVRLFRNEDGYGFRIVGGAEEGRNVAIGSIVIGGVAHKEGILKAGDEIITVNDVPVLGASHHHVVELMAQSGNQVSLLVRRKKDSDAYDVILTREANEGFGFVIISCGKCALIGRIIEGSPAARSQRLHIRDRIIAVNNKDITSMSHPEIVNIIKESGRTLHLRIIPADCYSVELVRGSRGFGFSIRGGAEFNGMKLYVLRIAPDGPAYGLLSIGDEIIEINAISTCGMTHHEAVHIISQSGPQVKLKLRRNYMMSTENSPTTPPQMGFGSPTSTFSALPAPNGPMVPSFNSKNPFIDNMVSNHAPFESSQFHLSPTLPSGIPSHPSNLSFASVPGPSSPSSPPMSQPQHFLKDAHLPANHQMPHPAMYMSNPPYNSHPPQSAAEGHMYTHQQ